MEKTLSTPVTIGGITAPDSELTRKAAALVEHVHSKPLAHHVHRTWWFAELMGRARGLKYDRELLYLASVLHDLGLTQEHCADQRFEVDGADAASRFLLERGYPQAKTDLVWDSIALHSSLGIVERKQPEIALMSAGAVADVFGLRLDEITPSLVDDVIQLYPRIGMKAAFTEALAEIARKKPYTALGTGLADVGRRHVHGFECGNICDMISNAPFDS
jgi:hypothetical protein